MVLRILYLSFGVFLLSCGGAEETEEQWSTSSIENGEQLYTIHCLRCHGASGDLGASGSKNLKISTLKSPEIIKIITEGKGAMPAYANTLDSEEKFNWLSEYVISLRN